MTDNNTPIVKNKALRRLYIVIGSIFVVLGVIGAILPVMPTTIFFILAAYFYMRSSERLYQRLISNKRFGHHIRNYMEHRAMPRRAKIIAISMLWVSIIATVVFAVETWWLRAVLVLIAAAVTWYILSLNTMEKQQ